MENKIVKILRASDSIRDLLILMGITLVLGIYMIANTAVIAKDGVLYIDRAQQLATQFEKISNANEPFGFPALVLGTHKLFMVFSEADSNLLWIFSGQILVFLCRILTVGVLYFFGKTLFGRRHAFWGVLVFIFLPDPAEMGVDVLRDWPHLLFLFGGLLCLYRGICKEHRGYLFAAGLVSGLGFLIRPECAQVVLYGAIFFVLAIVTASSFSRAIFKNGFYAMLLAGFLVVFIPYANYVDSAVPIKLKKLYSNSLHSNILDQTAVESGPCVYEAGIVSGTKQIVRAEGEIFQGLSENLMYFFILPAVIGCWRFFRHPKKDKTDRWLIGMFIGFYILALGLLYIHWGYISQRHVLPLTAISCFFVPSGLEVISSRFVRSTDANGRSAETWFILLAVIGIAICIPKLLRPIGHDKTHYREAAAWIAENTPSQASFYTFDRRIPSYANRPCRTYSDAQNFKANFKQPYLIVSSKSGQLEIPLPPGLVLQAEFPSQKNDKVILIYKKRPHTNRVTDPSGSRPQK